MSTVEHTAALIRGDGFGPGGTDAAVRVVAASDVTLLTELTFAIVERLH